MNLYRVTYIHRDNKVSSLNSGHHYKITIVNILLMHTNTKMFSCLKRCPYCRVTENLPTLVMIDCPLLSFSVKQYSTFHVYRHEIF